MTNEMQTLIRQCMFSSDDSWWKYWTNLNNITVDSEGFLSLPDGVWFVDRGMCRHTKKDHICMSVIFIPSWLI